MRRHGLAILVAVPALALGACGRGDDVDTATYTCADFNKSLRTKDDNSSGQFINRLRDRAKLGQSTEVERREITLGIIFACRGKPGSTKPANTAVATAKRIRDGKFKFPAAKKAGEKPAK